MIACTRQKEPLRGVLKMLEKCLQNIAILVKLLTSNSGKVLGLYLRKISSQIKLQASSFSKVGGSVKDSF